MELVPAINGLDGGRGHLHPWPDGYLHAL